LTEELTQHLSAARDHAIETRNRTGVPELLPRPLQLELATLTGMTESDVSRCLNDPKAKVLKLLWRTANDIEQLLGWASHDNLDADF
jgi:hypothetical protein